MDNRYIQNTPPEPLPPIEGKSYRNVLRKHSIRRFVPFIFGTLVLVIIIGVGVYFLLQKTGSDANTTPSQTTDTATVSQSTTPAVSLTANEEFTTFKARSGGITIAYPTSWKASETDGRVTVISPTQLLPGSGSSEQEGKIQLTIQTKQTSLSTFAAGGATAARDSVLLTYAKPSNVQRAQTYLSFLRYADSTTPLTWFDALYITGDAGYLKDQFVPESDIVRSDPLISVSFVRCSDATCSDATALGLPPSAWDQEVFSTIMQRVMSSLIIT